MPKEEKRARLKKIETLGLLVLSFNLKNELWKYWVGQYSGFSITSYGISKSSYKMLWKNPNELSGQPNIQDKV